MAGLIDFGLLGPGIDVSGAVDAYTQGRAQKVDREFREGQVARQTKLDARDDQRFASRETAGKQIAAGDIAGAETTALGSGDTELYSQIKSLSAAQRKEAADHADIIGGAAIGLKGVPQEQRAASFSAMRPILKARGLSDAEIDGAAAKLDDQSLDAYAASALTVKDAIAKVAEDRKFGETVRMNDSTIKDREVDNSRDQQRLGIEGARLGIDRQRLGLEGQRVAIARQSAASGGGGGGGKAPSGYRFTASGDLEAIPGGPAGGGASLTEAQGKGTGYYRVAAEAARTLNGIKGYNPSIVATALDKGDVAGTTLNEIDRRALNAQRAFVVAALRSESGATYGPSEVADKNRVLFPVPGDTKTVLDDKARLRGQYLAALRATAGPGAKGLPQVKGDPPAARQTARVANDADFAKLPSGTVFIGPDGKRRTKP